MRSASNKKYFTRQFGLVFVSNSVILARRPVVAMFRQIANPDIQFSGWCFICAENNDPSDIDLYPIERLLEADPSVEPFLDAPVGSRFIRLADGTFVADTEED
jgi:hypothetical protein